MRINFNSDPDGAIVMRGDGKTLGLTPLSIEVPYSDSAVEFQFRKAGFEKKTVYVVPNLPSPLFATLRKIETPPPDGARRRQPADAGRRRRRPAAQTPKKHEAAAEKPPLHNDDEDGTLEPSLQSARYEGPGNRPQPGARDRPWRARRRRGCGRWPSLRRGARRRA